MKNEITIDIELARSILNELDEAYLLLCPCPDNFPITESVCDCCKVKEICQKLHKVTAMLGYTV